MLPSLHHELPFDILLLILFSSSSALSSLPALLALLALPPHRIHAGRLIALDPRPPSPNIPPFIRLAHCEPLDAQAVDAVKAAHERIAKRVDIFEAVVLVVEL